MGGSRFLLCGPRVAKHPKTFRAETENITGMKKTKSRNIRLKHETGVRWGEGYSPPAPTTPLRGIKQQLQSQR